MANSAVAMASGHRLAEIKKLSAGAQLRALDDLDLVPADRARLRQSLEAKLPFGRGRLVPIPSLPGLRRFAAKGVRLLLSLPGVVALTVGSAWVAAAISNTHSLVIVTGRGMVGVPLVDGSTVVVTLTPGTVYPVLDNPGEKIVLGLWQARAGYQRFSVPSQVVRSYPWLWVR